MADADITEDEVQLLLLDMLSSRRAPPRHTVSALTATQWDHLTEIASQHRVIPLLHDRYTVSGEQWPVPERLVTQWAHEHRRSAFQALNNQRVLRQIAGVLDRAGLRYAALKGAYLSQHAWSHSALRPMRDLDILVARDRAREAYSLLSDIGFHTPKKFTISIETGLRECKHLPMLWSSEAAISVEIHTRLLDKEFYDSGDGDDHFAVAAFERAGKVSGSDDPISYLDATDTLLHIILHAVVDHQFDNGPLIIGDVAHLIRTQKIDWRRFGKMVDALDCARSCQLAFALSEHYEGRLPITWDHYKHGMLPAAVLYAAGQLSLTPVTHRNAVELRLRLQKRQGFRNKIRMLRERAAPRRDTLAGVAGLSGDDRRAWLAYPVWLITRLYRHRSVLNKRDPIARAVRYGKSVNGWLAS